MALSLRPPVRPVAARLVAELPHEGVYEPRWNGVRCLLWRYHDEVLLQGEAGQDLTNRYSESLESLLDGTPPRCVLDGVLIGDAEMASYVCFDVLALDSTDLTGRTYTERRRLLEAAMPHADGPVWLVVSTTDPERAASWLLGADAVACLDPDAPYQPGTVGFDLVQGTGSPVPPSVLLG